MRVLAAVLALLLAPAAIAGENPQVQVALGKKFSLNFDLGFKLPCKHEYTILYSVPGIIEQLKPPELTGSTSFKFMAGKVGSTTATAMFTGPGGNCNGSASASVDIVVVPDLKYTEKGWKTSIKGVQKELGLALNELAGSVESEVDEILASFDDDVLSSLDAADSVTAAVTDGTADAAADCWGALFLLSLDGSGRLADGGLDFVPPSFQSGARGSLWDEVEYDVREDYEGWAEDAYGFLEDALEHIRKGRPSFGWVTYVDPSLPFELPQGPGLATDPIDAPAAGARIVAGAAWNDGGTGSLRWIGTGLLKHGAISLDVLGPAGFAAEGATPSQTQINADLPFGKWSYAKDGLSLTGSYRLEARYATDETTSSKVSVTLPGF
jgi:hypothetical protein